MRASKQGRLLRAEHKGDWNGDISILAKEGLMGSQSCKSCLERIGIFIMSENKISVKAFKRIKTTI